MPNCLTLHPKVMVSSKCNWYIKYNWPPIHNILHLPCWSRNFYLLVPVEVIHCLVKLPPTIHILEAYILVDLMNKVIYMFELPLLHVRPPTRWSDSSISITPSEWSATISKYISCNYHPNYSECRINCSIK